MDLKREGNGLLTVPQLILVGAHGRNSGKTLLASDVIASLRGRFPIFALKIVGIDHAGQKCHRGREGCGICALLSGSYHLAEETDPASVKDTARMLRAGADRAFLLRSLKECLPDAFTDFLGRVPKGTLIVCESNTLRRYVRPGVFLFAASGDGEMKPSAREVLCHADAVFAPGDTAAGRRVRVIRNEDGTVAAAPLE